MADFDVNGYLNRKLPTPVQDKLPAIEEAKAAKLESLRKFHSALQANHANAVAQEEARQNSWVGKLGLDVDSIAGTVVNNVASAYAGVSRGVGDVLSLAPAASAFADESLMTKDDFAAYNRYVKGQATADDMALLNTKKAPVSVNDTPEAKARAQAMVDVSPETLTTLQLFQRAQKARETGRNIVESFNRQDVVHQDNREQLRADLGDNFQSAWDQTGLGNLFEKGKEVGSAKDIAVGLGKLVYNAGEAAVTNPAAATEYMVENLPQLVIGGAGKVGKFALTAMNAGYAADQYQQGIENYKAANNGQLPPEDVRQRMAVHAAAAMLAEQVGELGQLKAIGKVRTPADVAADASKVGLKTSIKETTKAGATGFGSEALTEGFQTYAEGEAQLKPATAKDIYEGGVIGGLSGGGLSAGGRAAAELVGATPEKAAVREIAAAHQEVVAQAAKTGDVSALADPKSKTYDPVSAVAALSAHSRQEGTTEEQKQTNLAKADEILTGLQKRQEMLQGYMETMSPEALATNEQHLKDLEQQLAATDPQDTAKVKDLTDGIAEAKQMQADAETLVEDQKKLDRLNANIEQATAHRDQLEQYIKGNPEEVDVEAAVASVDANTGTDVRANAERLINLSMNAPEKLTSEHINTLVNNQNNGLTDTERQYLRVLDQSRIAENKLKDTDKVNSEVLRGGQGYIGLGQYRQRITQAITKGDMARVKELLNLLDNFVANHDGKSKALVQANKLYQAGKGNFRVERTKQGTWDIKPKFFATKEARIENGGLNVGKGAAKLVEMIPAEKEAIKSLQEAMKLAYQIKTTAPVAPSTTTATTPSSVASVASVAPETEQEVAAQVEAELTTEEIQKEIEHATAEARQAEQTQQDKQAGTTDQVQKDSSQEATGTVAKNDATESSVEPAGLEVMRDKTADKPFQEKNLIADYFKQSMDKSRPLTAVKNFLTQVREGTADLMEYLGVDSLTDAQDTALAKFQVKAKAWQKIIQKNLGKLNKAGKNDLLYRYKDMMQFFIQDGNIEENLQTALAYAAYAYVAENGGKVYNTPEEINAILLRDSDEEVSPNEYRLLGLVGTRQNLVIDSLGQKVVQALGLKPNKDAPVDLMPKLTSAMGAHAFKLLMDRGILQRTTMTAQEMAQLTGKEATEGADFNFIRLARDEQKNLHPEAEEIFQANKGSQNILDKLFKVEGKNKEPSFKPIPFNQKTTKGTKQSIPSKLAKIIKGKNAEANHLRQDMWDVVSQLSDDIVLAIAGGKSTDEKNTHVSNRLSNEAKNEGLLREWHSFKDFIEGTLFPSENSFETPMYFEHSVWKQQRVGIATNVVNPQTSKIHRHMLYRNAWTTQVDPSNPQQYDNFRLRVLEGLGVKTDKQDNTKSLASWDGKVNTPEIQKAVAVLVARMQGQDMTEAMQKDLLAGVQVAGEKMHSLDALMALAHQERATVRDKFGNVEKINPFTVQMVGEVDGVTNGPMLSHLLLGAANSVNALFGLLNMGGFFQVGSQHTQYNQYRGQPGNQDLYETTASHMIGELNKMMNKDLMPILGAIYAFTGDLVDSSGKVIKDGRNIIKTPLTAMVFGSSIDKAIDAMADKFIESVYSKMEQVASGKVEISKVIADLRTLGIKVAPNITVQELLDMEFDKGQIAQLKSAFNSTLGAAVNETFKEDFDLLISRRKELNNAARTAFNLYNAVYTGMKDSFIAELVKKGEIAVNGKGQPIHELTVAQDAELRTRLGKIVPVMQTLLSKDSNDLSAGLFGAKTKRSLNNSSTYQSEVQFADVFGDNQAASVKVNPLTTSEVDPGVAMVIMGVHSTDSAISHMAAEGNEVLNIHDAHGSGLQHFTQTAQNLNKATWYAMLNYSPAQEMSDMLTRTLQGVAELLADKNVPQEVKDNLRKQLEADAKRMKVKPEEVLSAQVVALQLAVHQADKTKLEALSQMASVDQYALEGGNYVVTDKDRAEAASKLAALGFDQEAQKAAEAVSKALLGVSVKAKPKTSVFGQVGKPKVQSDSELVEFFDENPKVMGKDLIQFLQQKLTKDTNATNRSFNLKLLKMLDKTIPDHLTVSLIDTNTKESDVLHKPHSLVMGWYSQKGFDEAIYIIGNDFTHSNIQVEVLLHELTHAAVAYRLTTSAAQVYHVELSKMLDVVRAFAKKNGITKFDNALENVDELVAYGMTSQAFQKFLAKVPDPGAANKLSNALTKFVDTLARLLGFTDTGSAKALGVLLTNVTALFEQSAAEKVELKSRSFGMAAPSVHTLDIHEALDDGSTSPQFNAHLKGLLSGIVESLHGPFGTFKEFIAQNAAKTPMEVFFEAKATGVAPFASAALTAGFRVNQQEAFALEQVEATVRAAVSGNTGSVSAAYSELERLYREARNKLKGLENSTNPEEKAMYEFVFTARNATNGRSDYLSRFAALGLAHEGFRKLLDFSTDIDNRTVGQIQGILPKLSFVFNKILNFLNARLTHTYDGQRADAKLTTLVEQLVQIETRRLQALTQPKIPNLTDKLEKFGSEKGVALRNKMAEIGQTSFFQNNKLQTVKFAGNMITMIGQDRAEELLDTLFKYRDRVAQGKYGIVMGVLNNVRGATQTFQEMLYATKLNEQKRKELITWTAQNILKSFQDSEKFTDDDKKALTYTFLRTDMAALLDGYTMEDIAALLNRPNKLAASIKDLENQLAQQFPGFARYFAQSAWDLGYFMVTGRAVNQTLMRNAGNIARMYNTAHTGKLTDPQIAAAEKIIDKLTTLRALSHVEQVDRTKAARIFNAEAQRTDGGNGIAMVLHTHLGLQKDARTNLFRESEALMVKGYLPEITNPNTDMKIVDEITGNDLELQGYKKVAELGKDPKDGTKRTKAIYVLKDGGLKDYQSGIVSLTSMQSRGTRMWTTMGTQQLTQAAVASTAGLFRQGGLRDPSRIKDTFAVPIVNATGKAVEYHYMMHSNTRDTVLERDNRFEHLLGAFAGGNMDKVESVKQNKKTVQLLKDFYDADVAQHPNSYLRVGPTSNDAELREIWNLLPEATKQEAIRVWGREGMLVRNDMLDITFGYRKMSYLADLFDRQDLNKVEEGLVWFMEQGLFLYAHNIKGMSLGDSEKFKKRGAIYARRSEKMWQEIVHEMKDIIVMKTGSVMVGNILSNVSLLMMNGVSFKDIVNSHRVAMKGAIDYKRDTAELFEMKHLISTGQTNGQEREINHKIMVLEERIARNPVRELMEAGLMPTIVEDVAAEDDIYSYKSRFVRMTDKYTSKVNPTVMNVAKNVYMAHDTKMYQVLSQVTQLSDFVARYTLFQHLTTKPDALPVRDAIKEAADSFINYDIPAHRTMQYLDDMGIFMFSKYFIRIQKVLLKLTREHPTRVFGMMMFDHYMNVLPLVTESSFLHHLGNNPINAGAFQYPTVLDDLATVHAGLSLFK